MHHEQSAGAAARGVLSRQQRAADGFDRGERRRRTHAVAALLIQGGEA